jgi:hypothetical protein
MKTSNNYSPKVSIEIEKLETLIKTCNQAINHSVQTETFIKHNPHVHVRELRKALSTIVSELTEDKRWLCLSSRVGEITEELDELNQEDKDRYEPDQDFPYLHDTIDEYVAEVEKQFDYEPTDEELSDSYGFTAKERADQAWQQKMEAKS